ncbi:MAG: chromosome segregation protein SMC [Alphaproteobacteria bacterium]|nr:chromosome segregation protein SMC [Alphaproteobacteria bacterium]
MQVSRLRLVGFKSFVEAAEFAIDPGVTGIVGPNGCGKSNLVEALRWVMGENSARRLRGGEMDDVIFAGTTARPARNIAEVALTIDNSSRDAPFAFNDRAEIEVVRRIERGEGSIYRVNGREVRARDVQLLFSDAASGAHSGALVSQGRIGALIDAKPIERRLILEEAAGTAGLHARRRETELKLDAAEENLARLDDVVATIETQFEALKKQARQAQRYRRLADQIRRTEALLFRARWLSAEAEAERSAAEHRVTEGAVWQAAEHEKAAAQRREGAETALPPLREAEAATAAELQRLTHARAALEQELQRVLAARGEAERRLAQLAADLEREASHLAEAQQSLTLLAEERDALDRAETKDGPDRELAAARLRELAAHLTEAETVLQRETEAFAAADARRAALDRRRKELEERRTRLEMRRAEAEQQRASLAAALVAPELVTAAAAGLVKAEARVGQARAIIEAAEAEMVSRLAAEQAALDKSRQIDARLARLTAEAEGLRRLLAEPADTASHPALLTALRVAPGFEAAIGAAFGDELLAPLADAGDAAAARFWVDLGGDQRGFAKLPEGANSLAEAVDAPPVLARSLAQAGWVESKEAGHNLQASLAPGQRLVDREGRLWRWDGFVAIGSVSPLAAEHLRHANRLAALDSEVVNVKTDALASERSAAAARAERQKSQEAAKLARQKLSDAETTLARARAKEAEIERQALTTQTRLGAAVELLERIAADVSEAAAQAEETAQEIAALPDAQSARAALDRARSVAAAARRDEAEGRATVERLAHETARRRERLTSIDLEQRAWQNRSADAIAQRAALIERRGALEAEIAGLAARPAAIAAESETLGARIAAAAAACRRSADALAAAERQLREASDASRAADQALAEARERLARLEGLRDGAREGLVRLAREIRERLGVAPEALGELAGTTDEPGDPSETAARLERLLREREGMGPVNLMAETEAAEIEARVAELRAERAELTEAIARLRHGISALDREVRQRLLAAFERLDRHFAELFTRLFGGGKAQLRLVDNEDPLAAGLEIMGSPPGKRLQSLSLLSGGEQALTALALLFAAFLTNPAPVCVLDEVDAALDDANVDRFCGLVGEIADTTGTRFLVVTHHRITMARVDRLFGVTMAERGVSQLVSVDLARAARLRQTA